MKKLLLLVALAACSKKAEQAPADQPLVVPAAEVTRGKDACNAYVAKACACAETITNNPAMKDVCQVAHALPEAIDVALRTIQSPDTAPKDARRLYSAMQKSVKTCVEGIAKLPTMGCP